MSNEGGTTAYRLSLSKQIISTATAAFTSRGIKSVKMDDIANELTISKRTLYEIFANKEQLLLECVKQMHKEFKDRMDKFVSDDTSVIAIIIESNRYQMVRLNSISPKYYSDLHKYASVIKWIDESHKKEEKKTLAFFKRGVDEGYFRKDLDYSLINKMSNGIVDYIMENQLFKDYTMKQILHNIIMLSVRGLCTLKGVEALEKYDL